MAMALRDERKRLEALFDAVRRKAGPLARLDDEQRAWFAAWREDQPTFDYAATINSTDEIGEGLRGDIRRVLYGDVPTILASDTDAQAAEKWTRYLERQ
ncbi:MULTISPECIES: hypothetical protein [unclassified Mesorhizobium]|uniref:hypothetical protein n=1 Tax=unclassified Mesorhizobium TaxID=325217 RepID=UPI001093FF53|nr:MULTISPECIES: hypothetical protein [unclassified Mesorhizobium]TGS46399.1 hypothetical protein EN825_12425 [Mesorhizobium sp. M8A.F.Ca.ET.182.01.1.1]TGS81856.1 hypothetical protein EN824_12660 [Mesorhizobium sp. M8A.F.Ca.ET.181.01.1.1]